MPLPLSGYPHPPKPGIRVSFSVNYKRSDVEKHLRADAFMPLPLSGYPHPPRPGIFSVNWSR
eukprot:6212280-Pleurochrysis_carterae.AAC.1